MILLDTNVLSALMRADPDLVVIRWLNAQTDQIWTSAVSVFETRYGLAQLAAGQRRRDLDAAFDEVLKRDLGGRIAPLDSASADAAGVLAATREALGRPVDFRDTMIAGIAIAARATIATRNVRHFGDLKVPVVDPWADVTPLG